MTIYRINSIFHTVQGEGMNAGQPAVFVRFAGCNLWSGREDDRVTSVCRFCDTDFSETARMNLGAIVDAIDEKWPTGVDRKLVVFTGGEPCLQLDATLVAQMHSRGFRVAIETNGTLPIPSGVDWVCVSPKAGAKLHVCQGDELKLVFPQIGFDPSDVIGLLFDHYILQPMDGPNLSANTARAVEYVKGHPRWRLGVQAHKAWDIR